ncbi:DMT family transporter [Rhodovulum iodosum]|nr:DMT family transporter [Rhodovulum robiginosum]
MVGFTVTAPVMDTFAKLAGDFVPVGQIVAARFAIQVAILFPLAGLMRVLVRPTPGDALLHLARAALILLATTAFFAALRHMPLADAIAVFFIEPFVLTLLGALFLGESVGWRRIAACVVGFAGAMMVIRPSFAAFGPVALLPVCTAFCFASYMVLTRRIARRMTPVALQAWTALAACLLIGPVLVLARGTEIAPLQTVWPEGRVWVYLAGVGLAATVSHIFISGAVRLAPTATVAPLQYLEIVAATALGYAVFGDLPDTQTFAGIAVIVAAGLYVFVRERHLSRPPLPPP